MREWELGNRTRGLSLAERIRFHSKPNEAGCWIWQARIQSSGYGKITVNRRSMGAHRASFIAFKGDIPPGLTVDHLCYVPACVNPDHLRLLSQSENSRRARPALSQFCAKGHEFNEANTRFRSNSRGWRLRICRACHRERAREYRARLKASA